MDLETEQINIDAFLALVRAGLWTDAESTDLSFQGFTESVDWEKVYQLAEEQSVIGLVLAGIEHADVKPPQELLLQWIGEVQILEQQNKEMNQFIAVLIEKMRNADIYTLLVKGQGIARCYESPLWRSCGDVDLFLSDSNYEKAKAYLIPLACSVETEYDYKKHLGMTIDQWVVELHGNMRCGLSVRMDKAIDDIQNDVFYGGNVRSWINGHTQVFLPGVDSDVLFVFTHFVKHFYKGGLGLRQVCDWCRLLWTYRDKIDVRKLERRLQRMSLMSEWKVFGAFAVKYLGMPVDAMPLYDSSSKWTSKADRVCSFVLKVGNMGHSRDISYYTKYPYAIRKACSLGRRIGDVIRHARIFPLDSFRFFPNIVFHGVRSAMRGE